MFHWYVSEITSILTSLAKKKGCEAIYAWLKASGNHLYWSACSTHDGNGKVIVAKFKSFLSHIVNKHEDLPDPLFSKCAHASTIPHREYLIEGTVMYCIR